MYSFASTSEQSLLDLVNADNSLSLGLGDVSFGSVQNLADTTFVASKPETNAVVIMQRKTNTADQVELGYHRLDASTAFGENPTIAMVLADKTNTQIYNAVLAHIRTNWGVPVERGTYSNARDGNVVTVTFNGHYILDKAVSITLSELISLPKVVTTVSTGEHFVTGDDFAKATSADVMLALINTTNGLSLTFDNVKFSVPMAIANGDPTDQVVVTGLESGGYADTVTFVYNRLQMETLAPDGLQLDDFADFNTFYDTVTAEYLAEKLSAHFNIPFKASEINLRGKSIDGEKFVAQITITDNYIVRTSSRINMWSNQTPDEAAV